ncbi:MAG: ribonuclease D [Alphaproteobacteria bacterium]|jgi:ribonuclease D|nr:ribonuclease D [Alphaproteobacteria bacterium]
MTLITDTEALEDFCADQAQADFIAVDTEFLRENTYWPKLCLVQIAGPGRAVAVDPLAPGMDLAPLYRVMADTSVLKVFHSARQDIEIFVHESGAVPRPLFDTQVAAMVCGFGESVAYDTLASRLAGARIDKSSRFTDWSKRPLTDKQLRYALDDVVYLRPVYEQLRGRLTESGRESWLEEEMAVLTDPATYAMEPEQAWRRIKTRSTAPRVLAVLREVAAWREREAQKRDLPRGRLLRDEVLIEISNQQPRMPAELARCRGLSPSMADGWQGAGLLAAVARAQEVPLGECPRLVDRPVLPPGAGPVVEMLKVLLKLCSDEHGVAQKLIANVADLEQIAIDDAADVPALRGWRRQVFGDHALAVKHGRLALAIKGKRLTLVPL